MTTFSTLLRAGLLTLLPLAAAAQLNPAPAMVEVKTQDATPLIRLRLQTGGGFYLGGNYNGNFNDINIPAEGSGTRLMWYPEKAAFRAGYVDGTQWDAANIGQYSFAGGYNSRASGDYGTAFGYSSVAANSSSTALGQYCTASGNASVALGYYAHTNARQGAFVFSDRSVLDDGSTSTDESFRAPVNHSANWRVTGGFRVVTAGIAANGSSYTATRGVSILPGTTSTTTDWGQSTALIATSSGAYLSAAGVWTNTSDVHKKHLFEAVSGEDVLTRLRRVPMQRWSYKAENARVRHLGPMAQDFRRAFGLGPDSVSIGTVDADGVALAGVQALELRTRTQATQLAALQNENNALRTRLDALETPARPAGMPLIASLLALGIVGGSLVMRKRR